MDSGIEPPDSVHSIYIPTFYEDMDFDPGVFVQNARNWVDDVAGKSSVAIPVKRNIADFAACHIMEKVLGKNLQKVYVDDWLEPGPSSTGIGKTLMKELYGDINTVNVRENLLKKLEDAFPSEETRRIYMEIYSSALKNKIKQLGTEFVADSTMNMGRYPNIGGMHSVGSDPEYSNVLMPIYTLDTPHLLQVIDYLMGEHPETVERVLKRPERKDITRNVTNPDRDKYVEIKKRAPLPLTSMLTGIYGVFSKEKLSTSKKVTDKVISVVGKKFTSEMSEDKWKTPYIFTSVMDPGIKRYTSPFMRKILPFGAVNKFFKGARQIADCGIDFYTLHDEFSGTDHETIWIESEKPVEYRNLIKLRNYLEQNGFEDIVYQIHDKANVVRNKSYQPVSINLGYVEIDEESADACDPLEILGKLGDNLKYEDCANWPFRKDCNYLLTRAGNVSRVGFRISKMDPGLYL